MFSAVNAKTDLNQVSLTGMRAIVLLGLLMIAPRSLDEIRKIFISYNIMDESHSDDIIRIDLNTLKHMGCQISRSSKKTNFKYVLGENPFSFKLSAEDLKTFKKVYGVLKQQGDVSLLIEYHNLFYKIAEHVSDTESKEALLGISNLKYYNLENLKELLIDCAQERVLEISYYNPSTKIVSQKLIQAQKLVCKNDKIYLYGFDIDKKEFVTLNIKRIKEILTRCLRKKDIEAKFVKIRFKLSGCGIEILSDEEIVIEASDDGYIVEGEYYNEFLAMQRILSFGSKCTVIEPEDFKRKVIAKLKEMREVYGG